MSEDTGTQHLTASCFVPLIGLSLGLWGLEEAREGALRGRRRTVRRASQPALFWSMLSLRRLLPAAVLIPAGFWHYFFRAP